MTQQFVAVPGLHAIVQVADRLVPRFQHALLTTLHQARNRVDVDALIGAIMHRSEVGVLAALGFPDLIGALRQLLGDWLSQAALDGVRVADAALPALRGGYRYDLANPEAVAWAQAHSSDLAEYLVDEDRTTIRARIGTAMAQGLSTDDVARQLRDSVALAPRDAEAAERLRTSMLGGGASVARADRVVAAYRDRLLNRRAETIARTEILTASNRGQQLLWEAAVRDGTLPAGMQKRWLTAHDDRLCPYCAALDGKIVPLDGEFTSDELETATLTPPLHARCRCTTALVQ